MMKYLTVITLLHIMATVSGCHKEKPISSAGMVSIAIKVDGNGYHPDSVRAPAGQSTHLIFTRTSDEGCGQQLVFPTLGIRKDLPLNQAVTVNITMPPAGALEFTCGMNMYRGAVVAK